MKPGGSTVHLILHVAVYSHGLGTTGRWVRGVRGLWRSQPRPNLLIALTSTSNGPGRRHGKRNRGQVSLGLSDWAPSFPVLAKDAADTGGGA